MQGVPTFPNYWYVSQGIPPNGDKLNFVVGASIFLCIKCLCDICAKCGLFVNMYHLPYSWICCFHSFQKYTSIMFVVFFGCTVIEILCVRCAR
jgi:hypothetical protein